MKCQNPFWGVVRSSNRRVPLPCGQCLSCRINRRRTWQHRIMLEALQHTHSSFWTLTYRDEELPMTRAERLPTLSPRHLTLFLKRLRKALSPSKVRFFAVGEYGEQTNRPHYHLIIFGLDGCRWGQTRTRSVKEQGTCCIVCSLVQNAWTHGQVYGGTLSRESAAYVAGYTIKKMTSASDARLRGRHPEFSRVSRMPGLGAAAIPEIASVLMQFDLDSTEADVPVSLRHGSRQMPLGMYLRRKLRAHLGKSEKAPDHVLAALEEGVQPLRAIAFDSSQSITKAYQELFQGEFDKVNFRQTINKRKEKL